MAIILHMATLMVRDVDDVLMQRLRQAAEVNHRSLAGEVRARLAASLAQPVADRAAWLAQAARIAKRSRPDPEGITTSEMISAMRREQAGA